MAWQQILAGAIKYAPGIIDAGTKLYESRAAVNQLDPKAENTKQIAEIITRIEKLEASHIDQASILKQTTDELQRASGKLNEVSSNANVGLWLGIIALVTSGATLIFVLIR